MKGKIVHILAPDIFTISFIHFINKEFDPDKHLFLFIAKPDDDLLNTYTNIRFLISPNRKNLIKNIPLFFKNTWGASKIILHGNPVLSYFILFPWLLKKIYWIIYGYELEDAPLNRNKTNFAFFDYIIKNFVLKRVYGHITHIKGDSELANIKFKSTAKFYYSPMYMSNVVTYYKPDNKVKNNKSKVSKILVGNSTSPTNNHTSIFELLILFKKDDILIYCPLSYGHHTEYRNEIIQIGNELFGDKFIPLTNFMKLEEYNSFLKEIDIAIFNHNRQEAMGITLTLLAMGKTIYMNSQTTSFQSFTERGIKVFDNKLIEKEGLFKNRDVSLNPGIIYKEYSYKRLISTLTDIFNE